MKRNVSKIPLDWRQTNLTGPVGLAPVEQDHTNTSLVLSHTAHKRPFVLQRASKARKLALKLKPCFFSRTPPDSDPSSLPSPEHLQARVPRGTNGRLSAAAPRASFFSALGRQAPPLLVLRMLQQ